jgi:hypothetical protein
MVSVLRSLLEEMDGGLGIVNGPHLMAPRRVAIYATSS